MERNLTNSQHEADSLSVGDPSTQGATAATEWRRAPGLALCLSGGGYRAAAFHLGTLDVLNRLGLLSETRVLSTISGGTITGAAYAVGTARGEAFETIARRLYRALAKWNVVAEAFQRLGRPGDAARTPSLIRAAATVYAESAFVGTVPFDTLARAQARPDALIFSATEFRTGRAFRFQSDRIASAIIGSSPRLGIPDRTAREIRLADIVAASSCFPSVFEPIRFPDDFEWARPLEEVRTDLGAGFAEPVPLMDGGIFDNQGVDGVLRTYRRWRAVTDLLIVSDTTPPESTFLEAPVLPRRGRLTLGSIVWLGRILFVGALLSAVVLGWSAFSEYRSPPAGEGQLAKELGLPFLFSVGVASMLGWIRWRFGREQQRLHDLTQVHLWPALRPFTVPDALELANTRLRSLIALTSGVFMKRVRRLIQESVVHDRRLRGRVAFNLIYDLTRRSPKLFSAAPWLQPSKPLIELARRASSTPTVLWMRTETELRDLVACGQATTCFTLLRHLQRPGASSQVGKVPAATLVEQTRVLWERLQDDPAALLDSRIIG